MFNDFIDSKTLCFCYNEMYGTAHNSADELFWIPGKIDV